jgi:signal peptidase II
VADAGCPSGEGVQAGVSAGERAAARTGRHWLVFVLVAATIVILDQLTKAMLVANLDPGQMVSVVGDYIRLVFSQNSGALFGLFRDQAILFAIASLVVIGLIVAFHGQSERSLYLSIALGLLLGGAIGNMIDRLRLGYVVDFVDIGIGGFRWYTFNLADAAISTALVMLFALAFIPRLAKLGEGAEPSDRPEGIEPAEGETGG